MTDAAEKPDEPDAAALLEAQMQELIGMCGGDVMQALRTALTANSFLEAEIERMRREVSTGFVRGKRKAKPN